MVSCRELTELFLDGWIDRELPPRRRRECALHLLRCHACADHVADYRRLVALLRAPSDADAAGVGAVPEELVQAIVRECASR